MRWTPATALVMTLAVATGGCSNSGDTADPDLAGAAQATPDTSTPAPGPKPTPEPTPAISPRGSLAVMGLYLAAVTKANGKLDPALAAKVETGSALKVHAAQYAAYRRNDLRYGPVKYTGALAAGPKVSGYPKWFFAAATDSGSKPATRDFLLFVQEKAGAPWRATYAPFSRTATGPLAPGVDVDDFPAVVPLDDPGLAVAPDKLPAALGHSLTQGARSPYDGAFAAGRTLSAARKTMADNRSAFGDNGWTGTSRAVAAGTPVYAARTKAGGALVWFGIDLVHNYRAQGGSSGLTWETSSHGDLHKGFGLPSTIRRSINRVERYEMVAYIPPKGKGRIHLVAGRWFPLSLRGS